MLVAVSIGVGLVLLGLAYVLVRLHLDAPDKGELERLRTREKDYELALQRIEEKTQENERLREESARVDAELSNEKRSAKEKLELLASSEERLKTQFENLANRIFEDKGKVITEQSRDRIESLLTPFKEQLGEFRKRVDDVHQADTAQSAKLLEQVRQLQETTNKVSDEANSLARAIKGDAKKQGDWGEVIVSRIFEASGLTLGREYEKQPGIRDEEGLLKRPDFIVNLPGNKVVIVDSKVSLTAYEKFCSADDELSREASLAEHVKSVRRHVERLTTKNYSELLGNRTLDFVLMCIPLEPAFQAALQAEERLLYDLATGNVVVTGPTTLTLTLKLIGQIWRRENESQNAEVIAEKAGKLYDQVALIAEGMLESRKKIQSVSDSFDVVMKRLGSGRGNLVRRVEDIRRLGANAKKQIPPEIVEQALIEDDSSTEDQSA